MKLQFNPSALYAGLFGVAASVMASPAMAAAVDVDDLVADIALQAAPVAAVAGAVLLIVLATKAFKWVRRAL